MRKEDLRMWECECGCIYHHDLKECPVCNSKKREKSKLLNFIPIKLGENKNG